MNAGRKLEVAVILAAHGIKGEVRVKSLTADPSSFAAYGPLEDKRGRIFEILRVRSQKDGFIVAFKGITDRNAAEALRGVELLVARDRLPAVAEDEVYALDLLDSRVELVSGEVLGKIVGVPNFGAGDLLEVVCPDRKETVLLPFAAPYVVKRQPGLVIVDLPEGYLDEET
jgi:16S rRNA processing protein RimM